MPQLRAAPILVVDDNAANRELSRDALEHDGFHVILAASGLDGIDAFRKLRPSCVLLDVRMRDIDGFTVCEQIRKLPRGAGCSVLFLTAQRDVETFDRAIRAGGDDFLTKPIGANELVARVQSTLKLHRLSAELRDHCELLKEQRDALLRLQLQKERVTAFVIHDLKNPVSSLDLHAQFLQRHRGLPADARESVLAIRKEARQLTSMISNLLDISKADAGQLGPRLADVDLRALVGEVLGELAVSAEDRDVRLGCAIELARTCVDPDLFQRVLTNLVENAIRHSPSETTVMVTAVGVAGMMELRVADSGRGIAPEMHDKVFNAFVQVEGSALRGTSTGSRGLGLTFCKVAVEAHGGTIWVEDGTPGAVFCVRLPNAA